MSLSSILITEYKGKLVTAHIDGNMLLSASFGTLEDSGRFPVGTIIRGKIGQVQKQLSCFFVQVSADESVYLPFSNCIAGYEKFHVGSEITIQIIKEPVKTKLSVATMDLSIAGKFCAVHASGNKITYSHKMPQKDVKRLKISLEDKLSEMGVCATIRTNAATAETEQVMDEVLCINDRLQTILKTMETRKVFSILEKPAKPFINMVLNTRDDTYDSIITDITEVYELLKEYGDKRLISSDKISFYDTIDNNKVLSLLNAYKLGKMLDEAFAKNIYLPCGGSIVIEYTEAMTVIDVNSGKCEAKKSKEDLVCMVNNEAAHEIMHQIRLRNLSGMILVDFINMEDAHHQADLLIVLRRLALQDPVHVSVIDMTPLGIVEITRTKVNKSLLEEFNSL